MRAHSGVPYDAPDPDDSTPGQPWQPAPDSPSPDGSSPEGDGKHRK
ncbi:hypothetical protein OG875_21420 [Streptomyces sp. NBC_01498]|nr:hypothetical protein [Streptomyces sp. NBC_01498]WTL26900.1 hypothetical protein OG875_21420 [Streptomyces sp. NBC_01498]